MTSGLDTFLRVFNQTISREKFLRVPPNFILRDTLVHYHITVSSRESRHNAVVEGETEKQGEGRIRGEKATDATCLSHRYPDY